jgi:beta-carotene 3-hydroxylase
MIVLFYLLMVIAAFLMMEGVAWLAHKFLMHGPLWGLHKDHHDGGYHPFQRNDAFFFIFAVPCWLSTMFGLLYHWYWLFFFGLGILFYGICYFLVHDVIIHQRFKWFSRSNSRYIKVLRWAHKMHHKHLDKDAGESFGLLIVPRKYWEKVLADERKAERRP